MVVLWYDRKYPIGRRVPASVSGRPRRHARRESQRVDVRSARGYSEVVLRSDTRL